MQSWMYDQGRQRESRDRRKMEQTFEAALGEERDKLQTLEEAFEQEYVAKEARIKLLQEECKAVEQKLKAALEQERNEMEAVMTRDRDRRLQESKKILQEDHHEMERKLEAALEQARIEKEQEIDTTKANDRIAHTKIIADYQRQIDRARRETYKLRETIERDRDKAQQVLDAVRAAHREERKETKVLHEHQVDHLYNKIVSLEANSTRTETQRRLLPKVVEPSPIASASSRMTESRSKSGNEASCLTEGNVEPTILSNPHSVNDLKAQIEHLRRLNAEQSNTIRGLHDSLAIVSKQFEEFRMTHMHTPGHVFPFAGPSNQLGVPSFSPVRPPPGPSFPVLAQGQLPQQQWFPAHQNPQQGQISIPYPRPTHPPGVIGSYMSNPVVVPPGAAHIRQQFMDQVHQTSAAQRPTDKHA